MFLGILGVGVLSCLVLDLWQRVLFFCFGISPTNWGTVGRWFILFLRTRKWIHIDLPNASEIHREVTIGWLFHYLISIVYAGLFFLLWKGGFVNTGALGGLVFGIISVIVPWFFFMPALGVGILSKRGDNPFKSCILALIAHAIYGTTIGVLMQILV